MRTLGALACLALIVACGRDEQSAASAAPPVATARADSDGRLDPAPYRARIEAAETLLYSADTLSEEDWKALSAAFLELHNEIVFADGSATARETSAKVFFLSARADAMKSSSHVAGEIEQLRLVWQRLSDEKFTHATWIQGQTPSAP